MHMRQLEHLLAVVEQTLRTSFPDDFYKRCTYATVGLVALLRDAGEVAAAMGGDFVAFILSTDGQTPSIKGFKASDGTQPCSHFWVETPTRRIDLGTYFLPFDASTPSVAMPALAWDTASGPTNYLRYRALGRFEEGKEMADPAIATKAEAFVAACRARVAECGTLLEFPTWVATGRPSVSKAAKQGDLWAIGAEKFDKWVDPARLPF